MGCWHGCGPWHGYPPQGWYGPTLRAPDWYEDEEDDRPMRRRHRRERFIESAGDSPAAVTASLEARLEALHDELRRVEVALGELRQAANQTLEGQVSER
jgi:hypothetical protein